MVRTQRLRIVPITLAEANALVRRWHRHHAPAVGYRFAIGCALPDGTLVGAAIVGRPVSRAIATGALFVAEVTRLVTDGTKNACSILYAASARTAQGMGYNKIQTYILDSETGVSLKASGWHLEATTEGGTWNGRSRAQQTLWGDNGRRTDQPMGKKQRWAKLL